MSEAEANARRANRWTWACLLASLVAVTLAGALSFALIVLAIPCMMAAWACGFWCVSAKGYSPWLALLGPFVAVALPSLHPVFDAIRRRDEHTRDEAG